MRLQDHPRVVWGGEAAWPPHLAPSYTEGMAESHCDINRGVLKEGRLFGASVEDSYVTILVECGGKTWTGAIKLDYPEYHKTLAGWLEGKLGLTIKTIGEAEFPY
ncbi:MAG: hypothetical protein QME75_12110 [Deltaproteobacteria bacterium]|nr:hypothetical protein [Deltaproteobacteria bacterium]